MLVSVFVVPLALLARPSLAQFLTPPPEGLSDTTTSTSTSSVTGTRTVTPSGTSSGSGSGSASATSTTSGTSSANFPSLSGYSPCVSNCLGLAVAAVGCDSLTSVQCFCTSTNATRFSSSLVSCINLDCPTDLINAETVSGQFCALASPSTSLSFPPPTSTPSSATNTSGSSTPTSTAPPTINATGTAIPTQTTQTGGALGRTMDTSMFGSVVAVGLGSAIAALALGW